MKPKDLQFLSSEMHKAHGLYTARVRLAELGRVSIESAQQAYKDYAAWSHVYQLARREAGLQYVLVYD